MNVSALSDVIDNTSFFLIKPLAQQVSYSFNFQALILLFVYL